MQRALSRRVHRLVTLVGGAAALAIAAPLGGGVFSAAPAGAATFTKTFTVNSTADAGDVSIDGVCRTSANVCTLRAAIQEANKVAGTTLIAFNLPTPGTN